jgi:hypothetical protein
MTIPRIYTEFTEFRSRVDFSQRGLNDSESSRSALPTVPAVTSAAGGKIRTMIGLKTVPPLP